jgi:phosphate uptake regulator
MNTLKTIPQESAPDGCDLDAAAVSPGVNLQENLRFLVLRVSALADDTLEFLGHPGPALLNTILSADDYIDNLKSTIESNCFACLTAANAPEKKEINRIRATQTICINLERIADFCTNIARQQGYLHDRAFPEQFPYQEMFQEIRKSLGNILPVFRKADLGGTLAICRTEFELDRLYKENFDVVRERLRSSREDMDDLLTMLFIFRYLERVGDSILNIGEALLLSILGERIKIHQFQALQETLTKSGFNGSLAEVGIRPILGTRSGCRISRLAAGHEAGAEVSSFQDSIFKEGNSSKIRKEKENMERWRALFPELAPRVFSYHEEGGIASMLEEFLPGCPLDTLVLSSPIEVLDTAFFVLEETLLEIWTRTLKESRKQSNYLGQIQSRLAAIRQVHPSFFHGEKKVGDHLVSSVAKLLDTCSRIEQDHFVVPFTVFIHGDFNLNNVLYNHAEHRVHLIDLYRSREDDYVKDISVMLVSNFRLPAFDPGTRERLNWAIDSLYRFSAEFAQEHGDHLFQARMALALARSFFTSTRFELNESFAKEMFHRARYLLERIAAHEGKGWENFDLPPAILHF